MKAANAHTVR